MQCQFENIAGAEFCNQCGIKLDLACPQCGYVNPDGSKFCNQCGQGLSSDVASAEPTVWKNLPPKTPFDQGSPLKSDGERCQATILFSDLSGYTSMNESQPFVDRGRHVRVQRQTSHFVPALLKTFHFQIPCRLSSGRASDRLDRYPRESLRLASVIGREFTRGVALSVFPASKEQLTQALETLKFLELIQQTQIVPEAAYMFKHVIAQEVTYETLLKQKRKELHTAVGRAIEELYMDRLEEFYEMLAYHFWRGEALGSGIQIITARPD